MICWSLQVSFHHRCLSRWHISVFLFLATINKYLSYKLLIKFNVEPFHCIVLFFSFFSIFGYILAPCEDNDVEDELGTEPADTEGQAGEEGDTGAELDDGRVPLCII